MKSSAVFLSLFLLPCSIEIQAQSGEETGATFVEFRSYTQEEDDRILELFEGLRVADVSDAMDVAGLINRGLMDPAIHPLWRDVDAFGHQFRGIAVTVRYVPTNRTVPTLPRDEFKDWQNRWYQELTAERYVPLLRKGSVVVIDAAEDGDTGSIGSFNTMLWKTKGAVGVVTSGGARDTDEIIKQGIPVYLSRISRGYPPGRNELESINRPISVGGVLVRPGDVIVADGDGVIVVPREKAEAVAGEARLILDGDKKARRNLYEQLGLPVDQTVKP